MSRRLHLPSSYDHSKAADHQFVDCWSADSAAAGATRLYTFTGTRKRKASFVKRPDLGLTWRPLIIDKTGIRIY